MVFGKTTTLVVFLIISLKLSAEVCCDDYECNLIKDSGNCTSHSKCIYADQLCRDKKCSDSTSSNCENSNDCKYTGSACVDAPLCSDWSDRLTDCTSHFQMDASTISSCVASGSACKKAACSDFSTQGTCESSMNSIFFLTCKWTAGTCVTASSCADFSSADCTGKQFYDGTTSTTCILDGTVCKGAKSCADYSGTTNPSCSSRMVCTLSGGVCSNVKCSDSTNSVSCGSGFEVSSSGSTYPCEWDNNACRVYVPVCSDWNNTSASQCESNAYLNCVYNTEDNTCGAFSCGSINAGSSCASTTLDNCFWLSSCPVKENNDGGSASGIFAPALLVALLLVLFW